MKAQTTKARGALRAVATLLVLIMALLPLFSCGGTQESSGTITLVVGGDEEKVFSVELNKLTVDRGLLSVLDHLKAEGKLDYKADASGFLTEVGEVKQDAASGTYIYIWTSVEADFDVSQYATTKEYDGKTLTSTGVGTNDMTIKDGAIVYIGTIKW